MGPLLQWLKTWALLLGKAIQKFIQDKAFRHGASIAYFTLFSLPALVMVIIWLVGPVLGEEKITSQILQNIEEFMGAGTAIEVQGVMKALQFERYSGLAAIGGILTLLLGATGTFFSMRDALNALWHTHLPAKGLGGLFRVLIDRLLSLAMVVSLGFILLLSTLLQTLILTVNRFIRRYYEQITFRLDEHFPDMENLMQGVDLFYYYSTAIELFVSLGITMLIFGLIYRFLPDAKVQWRDVWKGALLASVLFTLGKSLIGWYIGESNVSNLYGAAGSIVVLLIWVYYSAQILLLGAEFTYVIAEEKGRPIHPSNLARHISDRPVKRLRKEIKRIRYKQKRKAADEPLTPLPKQEIEPPSEQDQT